MREDTKEDNNYRAKRRKRIKRTIVTICIVLFLLPIFLSLFLMIRVSRLEKKLDAVIAEKQPAVEADANPAVVKAEEKRSTVSGSAVDRKESPKKVYLTFDDGPSKQTKRVLDILAKKNVKATFFCVGRDDEFSNAMYKRIVDEGHTLGMHSYSHIYQEIYGSLEGFKRDFFKISEHMYTITGVRPFVYRFPGGSSNSVIPFSVDEYAGFLQDNGVVYQDWNVIAANGTTDHVTKDEMISSVLDGVARFDTSIVLMYDSADKKMTANSLEEIIVRLQEKGYELLPLDSDTVSIHHS